MSDKKEFGDFQTPESLATRSVALVAEIFGTPDLVIEPTAGLGAFLKASADRWGHNSEYHGYEINREYVDAARKMGMVGCVYHNFAALVRELREVGVDPAVDSHSRQRREEPRAQTGGLGRQRS